MTLTLLLVCFVSAPLVISFGARPIFTLLWCVGFLFGMVWLLAGTKGLVVVLVILGLGVLRLIPLAVRGVMKSASTGQSPTLLRTIAGGERSGRLFS